MHLHLHRCIVWRARAVRGAADGGGAGVQLRRRRMPGARARRLDPSQVFAAAAQSAAASTAWLAAAKGGNVGLLDALLERHSSALLGYRCPAVGNSALHWAAAKDHRGAVHWLLEHGAELELANNSGATALHSAAANGASACVDELLTRGADAEKADDTGRTAHDWAQVRAHRDVLAALRRHTGASPQPSSQTPSWPTQPQPMLSPSRGRVHSPASTPYASPRRRSSLAAQEQSFVGLDGSPWRPQALLSSPTHSASSAGSPGSTVSAGEKRRRKLAAKSEGRRLLRAEAQLEDQLASQPSSDYHRIESLEAALASAAEATRKGMGETERLRAKVASLESQLSQAATFAREEGDAARAALSACETRLSAEAKVHAAFRAQVEADRQATMTVRNEDQVIHARKIQVLETAVHEAQEAAAVRVATAENASASAVAATNAAVAAAEKRVLENAECAKSEAEEGRKRALETAAAATAEAESAKLLCAQAEQSVSAWEAKGADLEDRVMAAESESSALRQRLMEADERVIDLEAGRLKAEDAASASEEAAAALEAARSADQQGFEEAARRAADQAREAAEAAATEAAAGAAELAATQIATATHEYDAAQAKIAALEEDLKRKSAATAQAARDMVDLESFAAQHEEDGRILREEMAAALAQTLEAEDALTLAHRLTDSANAARDSALAELDAVRSAMKAMEASAQERAEAHCESELTAKQAAEDAALGLADSANAARDSALAELDTVRCAMKAMEASSQELVEAHRESELTAKQAAEDAARTRAEAKQLRADAVELKKALNNAEQAAVVAQGEAARAQELAQSALAQTTAVQSQASKARLRTESQTEVATRSPSAADASSTVGALGTPRVDARENSAHGDLNALQAEIRRLRNQITTLEAAHEISAAQEEEREQTRERERVEERQAELIRAEERERERAGYEALLRELQSERASAAETAVQAQEVQEATEEMVAKYAKLQQESQDERKRLCAELAELQLVLDARNEKQREDQMGTSMVSQSESTTQTDPLQRPQVSKAQTQTFTETQSVSQAELEHKLAETLSTNCALEEELQSLREHVASMQQVEQHQAELLDSVPHPSGVQGDSVDEWEQLWHPNAEAAIASARSNEAAARKQVELMQAQLHELGPQHQQPSSGDQHTQTDETSAISTAREEKLRSALERIAELEQETVQAGQSIRPSASQPATAGDEAAEAPGGLCKTSGTGDEDSITDGTSISGQHGAIVDGICTTCGADVPDQPLVKLRAALRVAAVQRDGSPSPSSSRSTASRTVWPPRTPLTTAFEEHQIEQNKSAVHPLLRVRDALRAHDAATVQDTKTMLHKLSLNADRILP